jgi:hypothetical protein
MDSGPDRWSWFPQVCISISALWRSRSRLSPFLSGISVEPPNLFSFGVLQIHPSQSLIASHALTAPRLSTHYSFTKPNDCRALNLMNAAASAVVSTLPDICIAYGVSDEYSFVFHKSTRLFERRAAKLVSTVVSTFTAFYVHLWGKFMEGVELEASFLPTFDGRAVCYPSVGNLRDYMRWRQVDCKSSICYGFGERTCC